MQKNEKLGKIIIVYSYTSILNIAEGLFMNRLVFEEVTENELFADYTADCSGDRSDCCTRVCTRDCRYQPVTEEDWGKFLNI